MAYDQSKLIKDVRMYIGCVNEDTLPESVIIYWGDFFDAMEEYTGNYPYILWNTTLQCLNNLKAKVATSTTSTKSTEKEKVGDVEITISNNFESTEELMNAYDELYNDYLENPWKFGIKGNTKGVVLINGVNQDEVDKYRNNPNTTSIYNPLPVTSFPRKEVYPYRRRKLY